MRADRLITIILLLQTHRSLTAKELADKLEVSERTIHRDMDALSSIGIPVYANRGRYGSFQLDGRFQTSLTGLNHNDIYYFTLPVPKKFLDDLGVEIPQDSSYMKLLSTAPGTIKNSLQDINNLLYIDIDSWSKDTYNTDRRILHDLQQAVWESHYITISYEKPQEIKSYTLQPLALVLKRSVWYIIAKNEDCIKNFRVDRILTLEITSDYFIRPKDFDLKTYWKGTVDRFRKQLPKYPIIIEVNKDTLYHLRRRKSIRIINETLLGGESYQLEILFDAAFEATGFIFEYGQTIRVIGPLAFIELLKKKASEIILEYT